MPGTQAPVHAAATGDGPTPERSADGEEPPGDADDGRARPGSSGAPDDSTATGGRFGAREVVVPLRVYKAVTVFSTLLAVVAVVGGFLALDAATRRASAPPSEIDPVLAVLGLAAIASGGVVYAYASRFRAPGMGTSKNGGDEGGDDG